MNTPWNHESMQRPPWRQRESNGPTGNGTAEIPRAIEPVGLANAPSDCNQEPTAIQRWLARRAAVAVGMAIAAGVLVGLWLKRR